MSSGTPWECKFVETTPHSVWKEVSALEWDSWVWQQQKRIKSVEQLQSILCLQPEEIKAIEKTKSKFRMAITPYYASLIDPENPKCPIRLQCVPTENEMQIFEEEMEDPLAEESHMPVPGLTHRYPDRALLYTNHNCPVYCRHCTRKRKVSNPESRMSKTSLLLAMDYIRKMPSIRDVLVSGGDPLSLSNEKLDWIFSTLRSIPHLEIIRLSTRNLVTLPQRVDEELLQILEKSGPVFVHTHFNHPKECTKEAFEVCKKISKTGAVIQNQMVLLRGINDDAEVVKELNHKLLLMRVKPYYMFQSDMAEGIRHFRTPLKKGIEILSKLRGYTSGMAVPHFIVDLPGGGGKVALLPEQLVRKEGNQFHFKNYEGKPFVFHDVGEENECPPKSLQG